MAVSFLVKGRAMEATLVLIFVSIIDLPSIISIIGGVKAKWLWQVGLVALLAAIIGEVLTALVSITYMGPELFPYRLIAQIIVASTAFYITQQIRKRRGEKGQEMQEENVALGAESEKQENPKSDLSTSSPWKEMGQAAYDVVPVMEKAAHETVPILVRFLGASWNILMWVLGVTGLMPLFKKAPWLHAVLIFVLMAIAPPVGVFVLIAGCVALNKGVKAESNFMVSMGKEPPERFMGAQSDEEEKEAYQGEAMLRVYENGATMEEAQIVYDAMGKVYDMQKAKENKGEGGGELL